MQTHSAQHFQLETKHKNRNVHEHRPNTLLYCTFYIDHLMAVLNKLNQGAPLENGLLLLHTSVCQLSVTLHTSDALFTLSPSMIPHFVFLPKTLFPFTWCSLSVPTTANGMFSWEIPKFQYWTFKLSFYNKSQLIDPITNKTNKIVHVSHTDMMRGQEVLTCHSYSNEVLEKRPHTLILSLSIRSSASSSYSLCGYTLIPLAWRSCLIWGKKASSQMDLQRFLRATTHTKPHNHPRGSIWQQPLSLESPAAVFHYLQPPSVLALKGHGESARVRDRILLFFPNARISGPRCKVWQRNASAAICICARGGGFWSAAVVHGYDISDWYLEHSVTSAPAPSSARAIE